MKKLLLVGAGALSLLCAQPTFAGFATSVTGNGTLVSAPSTALGDVSTAYQVWNESSGLITSNITLENNGAVGSYVGISTGTPTTLTTGTLYGSTFIQLNPDINGVVHSGDVIINFSSKIIGIALSGTTFGVPGTLDKTDNYGSPGTTYPTGYTNSSNNRGIINHTNDSFQITNGGTELIVNLTANLQGFKELRVFTGGGFAGSAAAGVPEPASLAIWSLVGTVFAGGRWWRRQRAAV
jgi:hypothetical protein